MPQRWIGSGCLSIWIIGTALAGADTPTSHPASLPASQSSAVPTSQPTSAPARISAQDALTVAEALAKNVKAQRFDLAMADFNKQLRDYFTPEKLLKHWLELRHQYGPFTDFEPARVRPYRTMHIVSFRGKWGETPMDMQVTIDADKKVAGLFFKSIDSAVAYVAPAYVNINRFEERKVEVGSDPWKLAGRLSMPRESGRHPAVVLVHGSGPHDEDETIGQQKPFRDLAGGLATRGIVVLRYVKRTKAYPLKVMAAGVTVQSEVIDDALAALRLLRTTEEVDPDKLYIIGHSLGGCVAPQIARADGHLAGFVSLSGTLRGLDEVVLNQLAYIAGLGGDNAKEAEKSRAELEKQFVNLRNGTLKQTELVLGSPASYWRDLNSKLGDAGMAALRAFDGRVLILGGGRDYQVTKKDFDLWRTAAQGRKNVTLRWIPNVSHLFVDGEGMATPQEYLGKATHVDGAVIDGLADWILGGDYPEPTATSRPATTQPSAG